MKITTNNHWREFKYAHEVPTDVIEWNDHLNEDERCDGWINYCRHWYHLSDFLRITNASDEMSQWHGYRSDSFFSGILIRLSDDGERYQIATYIS